MPAQPPVGAAALGERALGSYDRTWWLTGENRRRVRLSATAGVAAGRSPGTPSPTTARRTRAPPRARPIWAPQTARPIWVPQTALRTTGPRISDRRRARRTTARRRPRIHHR